MKIKKKYIFVIIGLVIIILFVLLRNKEESHNFVIVEKSDLTQEVNVTGRVEAAENVDLAFEKTGKVAEVNVAIGDVVAISQSMVILDNADLKAQLTQAEANLESVRAGLNQARAMLETEQANLKELKNGAKPEDIQLSETKVASAEKTLVNEKINLENVQNKADVDLANLYDDVEDILNSAYFYADDAVNKQVDDLFSNDNSELPQLTISTSDSQAKIDAESGRLTIKNILISFKSDIDNFNLDNPEQFLINGEDYLNSIRDFLNRLNDVVNNAVNLSQTVSNTYKSNINTARVNINASISSINTQRQAITSQKNTNKNNIAAAQAQINTAENNLNLAKNELALKKSGATDEQIKAQEAKVEQAETNIVSQGAKIRQVEAEIKNIQVQIEKTILKSPINGTVTRQDAKVGEIISPNVSIVSVISQNDFGLKANVPEADIAKIKEDNLVKVVLDAYGNEVVFAAKITSIDPAEKIIEGVATYKITASFIDQDERIKSGMTADMDIITAEKKNVLTIPSRMVFKKDNKYFVKLLEIQEKKEVVEEREIEVGTKGTEGKIEVIGGLEEGDKIIMP
ncbi:MAG: efflux RND transporter periplasmic adaptor subunit [Patescibacteria group bacterium]|jgi:HlyD family secretion protein|nr:efflux RND transporter periplasmic adaptor subunit [Patescibacteria group bacterium]MDD5173097.1 efflux RND transporter periplasmic adaptor subunit [Patescibacteria group bacterium]